MKRPDAYPIKTYKRYKLAEAVYFALHGGQQYEKLSETLFRTTIRVALFHLPFTGAAIAQVSQAKTKTAEPPNELPVAPHVIPFAATNFRGVAIEFGIKREDRRKHVYIIGKTGVGKSKLIELLALADIKEGKGCVVMDPHGDLAGARLALYDIGTS